MAYNYPGRQYSTIYGLRKRIPYSEYIESQIPSMYTRKAYQENKDYAEKQLGLQQEALDLSEEQLAEEERKAEANLALSREQMEEAEKQGKLSLGLGAAQTGILGAYTANKLGLGKKISNLLGLGKSTATEGVGATVTPAGGEAFEAFSTAPTVTGEADVAGLAAKEAALGKEAVGKGLGLTGPQNLSVITAAAAAAPTLGPVATSAMESLSESLGMGKQTAPGAADYLNAYLSGTKAGTDLGYGQSMPGSDWWGKASNVKSLLSGLETGYTPSKQLISDVMSGKYKDINQIRNALKFQGAGTYTDPTAH